jgi:hypothetical protein
VRITAQRARAEGEDTFLYGVLSEKTAEPGQDAASDEPGGAADTSDAVLNELDATLRSVEKLARKL